LHANPPDPSFAFLRGDYYQRFSFRTSTTLPRTLAAYKNLINLNHTRKSIAARANHGST